MQIIKIECITKNEIIIRMDDKELTNITGFSLEIKVGETERYYIEKQIPKPKEQETFLNHTTNCQIERWWTIPKVVQEFKAEDPKTAICYSSIKRLVTDGVISHQKSGRTIHVNFDEIKEYYRNGGNKTTEKVKLLKQKRNFKPIF